MPDFSGFISYMLISTFTPGPNNVMAMTNAAKYGYKRSVRFCAGVFIGFTFVNALCAVFCKLLQDSIPTIKPYMAVAGAAYILFLAYATLRDKPHEGKQTRLRTDSVLSGAILQFINVKCILYGVTLMSTYILPYYADIPSIALFALLASALAFVSTNCWALFGSVFQRVFAKYKRAVNAVMALLLVYCAAMILFTTL